MEKYPYLIGWGTVIVMWTGCGVGLEYMKTQEQGNNEVINTAEDMIEWINTDVENGRIYEEYAEMYIYNLKEIITRTNKLLNNEENN